MVAEIKENSWNFNFSKALDPAESIDLLEIKHDLRNIVLSPDEEDVTDGLCTAKALYNKLDEVEDNWEYEMTIRSNCDPPKVTFLMWAAMHESIPTRDMLRRRRVTVNSDSCVFCNSHVESQDHLFLHYSWAKGLWDMFLNSVKLRWVFNEDLRSFMKSWSLNRIPKRLRKVWHLVPFAFCWELWLERNRRVHGGRSKSNDDLEYSVKIDICLWSSSSEVFNGYSMNQILFHWDEIM
ncbi:uncharacterized protein LOC113306301 [Papaver somniferum]|uniref:uncharacterized protein LOC113306301 n=1 Tax=Papaver somniferum TaxID=3469 RepID=UPI000E6FEB14|nr:uncharacterized protein LOC113306301 [Papaver somniferum]